MLIGFEPWHLELAALPQNLADRMAVADTTETLMGLAKVNMVGTIVTPASENKDASILGIMGAVPKKDGECEVFILAATEKANHPIEYAKTVRKALTAWRGEFRTIRALGEDTDVIARWLLWLGFACEGPVEPGPDGEPMSMWVMRGKGGGH